jgi:polyisoprenyl-phosphate glycosyltransferase
VDRRKKISILCPVYNEEAAVPLFYRRLKPVLSDLGNRYDVDLVFLDNASTDGTYGQILEVRKDFPSTYAIVQSRNVGYQRSLAAGLQRVTGDLFVFIDVDCEDPPEMISEFVERHENGGYDIVYGQRVRREESQIISFARKVFYRILRTLADEEIILDMAEFALFTNEVREAIITENSSFPFIRASIGRVGFERFAIPYKRQARIAGQSNYNFIAMSIFAMGGILSASTLFLRLPVYVLPFWIVALFACGAFYLRQPDPFWLVVGALLFAVYVGFVLAFTALYVARTYKNGLERPNAFLNHRKSILPQ